MHKEVHLSSSERLADVGWTCWLSLFQFFLSSCHKSALFCFVPVGTVLVGCLPYKLHFSTSHQLSFTFGHPGLLIFHFALVNNMQEHHDASQEHHILHVFHTFFTWCTVSFTCFTCRFVSEALRGVCEDLEHLSRIDTPKAH